MVQVTIDVPEALAARLAAVHDRLPEILEYGLDALSPLPNDLYRAVLAFLATNPSPEAVLEFSPTAQMAERIEALAKKQRLAQLNASEMTELDEYLRIDNVMSLLKAQAFRSLQASS
jgi:hypothetical protein